jgi:type IV secretory pathway VirB4 component
MSQKQKEAFSSQSLLSLHQIRKGVIILKNGSLRSILAVSGINLDLKSENEQSSILVNWRNLLNNLDFQLEVVAHSRRVNIETYLNFLQERINQETNNLLKLQGEDYYTFINGLVTGNNIMKKKFYVVIPYDSVIIKPKDILSQIKEAYKSLLNLKRQAFSNVQPLSNENFNQYYQQLMIRQNNVINNFTRMGLQAQPLTTKELIELFFNLYNPETFERESINIPSELNQ